MKLAALKFAGRWLCVSFGLALMVGCAGQLLADDRVEFFEKHIRPALVKHCYECHSNARGKSEGDLLLESRPAIERGGESGKVVEAGRPDESLLVEAIRYESFEMPPGKQLDDETIRLFAEWIRQGAVDPRDQETMPGETHGIDVEKGRKFWAFRPREKVSIADPETDWGLSPIDCFILEKLEKNGLEPAGGGVKRGFTYGSTDDYGYYAAEDKMHVHDFHATLLHLLGIDHERLTYRYGGRDFRLTDVHGRVAHEIIA